MTFRRILVRLVPVTFVVAIALAVYLHNTTGEATVPVTAALDHPGTAALRAMIDPETGQLVTGPAAAQLESGPNKSVDAELANMLSRSDEGLTAVHHPDGHVSVNLEGRFMSATVARLNPDGRVETLCTENQVEATEFLEHKPDSSGSQWEVR